MGLHSKLLRSMALLRYISEAKPRSAYQSQGLSWFVMDFQEWGFL